MAGYISEIEQLRKMQNIERLSSTFKIRSYSLAEHSYYIGILFIKLAELESINLNPKDIETVLTHDFMETYTGDLVSTAKNLSGETSNWWNQIEFKIAEVYDIKKYTDAGIMSMLGVGSRKYNLFKLCDILDLYLFSLEERQLGNNTKGIIRVYDVCRKEIFEICDVNDFKRIVDIMNYFNFEV